MSEQTDSVRGGLRVADELAFYVQHLKTNLLPFWLSRSVDEEYGGFFTCFDNEGKQLLSHDKFTWSQGRIVWMWAKLASMSIFSPGEHDQFSALARSGAQFLMKHCLLPSGNCAFLLSREGEPKPQAPGMPLDSSIYADCFVVLGLARYAALNFDKAALDFAFRLYRSVADRMESGNYNSEPYPVPAGYKPHGIPMIMLNTSQEMAAALQALSMFEAAGIVQQAADGYLRRVMKFADGKSTVHEYIDSHDKIVTSNLLGRHVNPGHTIEDMWFVMHQALRSDNAAIAQDTHKWAARAIKRAFAIGWDAEFGGLLHFVDQDGGAPAGSTEGTEQTRVVQQIQSGWGDKLWWVHSEALYATLLAYRLTGDSELLPLYHMARDYAFRTFPNPDLSIGEWIQIRDRQGAPQQKVVALPVKDPFHIVRNVLLIIDLLTNWQEYGK